MNKLLITSAIAAPLVVGAGAFGGYKVAQMQGDAADDGLAELVSAVPTTKTVQVSTPRRECRSVPVQYTTTENRNRSNETANVVGGAVIGGAIGNAVGGRNRDKTTIAGALVGGYLGHERAARRNAPRTVSHTRYEQQCDTVHDRSSKTIDSGYDVTYRYQGQLFTTHMKEAPPARFPVAVNVVPAGAG